MLESMRKHARFFYVLFVIVILSFIFWGVGTTDKSSTPSVVEIGKDKITVEEYWRQYEQTRTMIRDTYKEKFNDEMEKKMDLKNLVLDTMITDMVFSITAGDLGITVTDKELQDVITHDPEFMRNGVFSQDVYFRALQLQRQTPEMFESSMRKQILSAKVIQLIGSCADINPLDFKNISGDDKAANEKLQAIMLKNRNAARNSYATGLSQLLHLKINKDLIS
ncbi:MAG: SurA N-terminal domain-containing protein [Dissulfurispiraceae bacterium]